MPVIICLLRGVNVGGYNKISMEILRELCSKLKLCDIQTYLQSGNAVFRAEERDLDGLSKRIQVAIERKLGFRPEVILRTVPELRDAIARNPFAKRRGLEPRKLAVTFLAADPGKEARENVLKIKMDPEELRIDGREMYIYFPNGMGRPSFSWSVIERTLKVALTSRNWNTVTELLQIGESLEASR
jgi:uncharacterized protein (DUF1697 family)